MLKSGTFWFLLCIFCYFSYLHVTLIIVKFCLISKFPDNLFLLDIPQEHICHFYCSTRSHETSLIKVTKNSDSFLLALGKQANDNVEEFSRLCEMSDGASVSL